MRRSHILLALPLAVSGLGLVATAVAAQEVVQALPNPASAKLAQAMQQLSGNPNSLSALVNAGRASLDLDDTNAALGFFSRAQRVAPEDGRVLTGLARVALSRGDAVTALQLFDNANLAGEPMQPHAADRGLAYDLVGNNSRAQRLYRQALSTEDSPEITRRLALSYAISGDQAASEAALLPLLDRQDRAAFRSRAFALAILGREDEAVTIAETMLPARLANRMSPYLRYMGRLTRAQQAAAANLGRFPAASQIGREDPRMAAIGIAAPEELAVAQPRLVEPRPVEPRPVTRTVARTVASLDERLIPSGEPLAQAAPVAQPATVAELPSAVELAPIEVAPIEVAAVQELPPVPLEVRGLAQAAELPAQAAPPVMVAAAPSVTIPPISEPVTPAVSPSFSITDLADTAPSELPEPLSESPEELVDLAEAFAEFAEADTLPLAPAANAVDITTIDIPRERPQPETPAAPPPPAHLARQWVQIATGQDLAAFRFDWRRLRRGADGLLDDREAYSTAWNQTNRLLTGPFATAREAQQFVSSLSEAGVDSFRFASDAGQEIKPLQ